MLDKVIERKQEDQQIIWICWWTKGSCKFVGLCSTIGIKIHCTLLSSVYLEETWFGSHSRCDKSDNIYYAHDTLHFTLDTNAYPGHVFVSSLLFIMNQTVPNQFNFYLSNHLNSRQSRPKWMNVT